MPTELKAPDAELTYEFDWSGEETEGVTLVSVVHTAPYPLLVLAEHVDAPNWRSYVRIGGGMHAAAYVVTATATLSSGDIVSSGFPLRIFAESSGIASTATMGASASMPTTP